MPPPEEPVDGMGKLAPPDGPTCDWVLQASRPANIPPTSKPRTSVRPMGHLECFAADRQAFQRASGGGDAS
jgi:hypothetical protein